MKIREFVKADFDVNTNIKIFDGTNKSWQETEPIYSGFGSPADVSDEILEMDISYITTDGNAIVIEGKHSKYEMFEDPKETIRQFLKNETNGFMILQVKESAAGALFSSINELLHMHCKPDIENYSVVYCKPLTKDIDVMNDREILERLYQKFNVSRPKDYKARSMSVSDVVILKRYGATHAYFVDSIGFATLSDSFLNF